MICLISFVARSAELRTNSLSILVTEDQELSSKDLQEVPHSGSVITLLDQLLHAALWMGDNSGSWALPEQPMFSIYGESWVWSRWYWEGHDISDPLFAGAPAVRIPYALIGNAAIRFNSNPSSFRPGGLLLQPADQQQESSTWKAGASYTVGSLGGQFSPTLALMDQFSGKHSIDRKLKPVTERPQLQHPVRSWGQYTKRIDEGQLISTIEIDAGKRLLPWVDSPVNLQASVIPQPHSLLKPYLLIDGALLYRSDRSAHKSSLLLSILQRDRFGMEYWRAPQESAQLQSIALDANWSTQNLKLAALYKQYRIIHHELEFAKDYYDPDGQELEPWYPGGTYQALTLDGLFAKGGWKLSGRQQLLLSNPESTLWHNQLTVGGRYLGQWRFVAQSSWLLSGEARGGYYHQLKHKFGQYDAALFAVINYGLNRSGQNSLMIPNVGARLGATWRPKFALHPFVTLAATPIAPHTNLYMLINPDHLSGQQQITAGGSTEIRKTMGGTYINTDALMTGASIYALNLGFESPFTQFWTVRLQAQTKLFHNLYQLALEGDAKQYGFYRNGIFYFDSPQTKYRLDHWQGDMPFYYGAHFQLIGEKPGNYLFSWSFTAYNAVGRPGMGNGPLANDPGVVHYGQADPNAAIRGFGNYDLDRAFSTTILVSKKIIDTLWAHLTITHLDGTPFAPFAVHQADGLLARTNNRYRGSPLTFSGPLVGDREDYLMHFDLKLSHTLRIHRLQLRSWLQINNLFDYNNEIAELQTSFGQKYRTALYLEPPRSLEIGLEVAGF